jgi:nucleoside-diphosphate-sugar epimerase
MVSLAMFKPLMAGQRIISPIPVDVPRTWTSVRDAARLLATVANEEEAWGKAWHVPSYDPMTARELLVRFAQANDLPEPRIWVAPWSLIWTLGIFVPMVREIRTTRYQFTEPFVMDSRRASATFGHQPEPLENALRDAARMLKK